MAIKGWKQVLGRLLRRRAQERERIHAALWREITRREWADYRNDPRQDNGQAELGSAGIMQDYFAGMVVRLASRDPQQQAAGVLRHRRLAQLARARREG